VHYGTDLKKLSQTAKSDIRLNQDHRYTIFRARIDDLPPKTTYYYITRLTVSMPVVGSMA
jgi:hypothetical protein